MEASRDISRLIEIMAALRTPGSGCPWDLEQNFATIAPYTLEEAYEVADAIVRGDLTDLREELGDLLLQVVFHGDAAVVLHRLGQHFGVPMKPAYASAIGAVEDQIEHDAGRGDASFDLAQEPFDPFAGQG